MQYYAATVAEAAETGIGLWMRQHLERGGVMIDVGANAGAFTELGAQVVGPTGRIIAFEPGSDNAERLRERFGLVPQVTIVQAAVSDRSGSANFFLDRRNTLRKGALKPEQRISDFLTTAGRWSCINRVAYPRESGIPRGAARETVRSTAKARNNTNRWLRKLSRQFWSLRRR